MTHYIYLLEFKDNSAYIGQTTNLKKRLYAHTKTYGNSFCHTVIDECESDQALLLERMWMQIFYSWGFTLKNRKHWTNVNLKQRITAGCKIIKDDININDYLISERMIKLPRHNTGAKTFKEFTLFRRKIIGGWIKHLRRIENVTQLQIADHLGIERSTFCKIESGKQNYSAVTLLHICEYLKVDYTSTLEIF